MSRWSDDIDLEHLRRQGNDLHEVLVAKLAGNRPEDSGATRIVLRAQDHSGVLVKAKRRAIGAPKLACGPDHDCFDDLGLLHLPSRSGDGDGGGDDIANRGVLAVVTAHHPDQQDFARSRVIRHLQSRLLLDHGDRYLAFSTMATTRQRLSCEIGRVSMMRTRSPTLHWFCSSWALNRVDCRMCFL